MHPLPRGAAAVACLALLVTLLSAPAAQSQQGVRSVQPLPAVTDSDDRFGIGNIYPHPHWLTLAQWAGVRWNRWEFRWNEIEPRPGHFDWGGADEVVAASRAAGLKIQGTLTGLPRWAEARTPSGGIIPRGLYEPWDSPTNTWGRFMRAIAERYRGQVQAWEIWNEPDYPRGHFAFWWGSKADYYQLLKVAYRAIRSVDPDATVLLAGLMYWGDPSFLPDLLDLVAADPEAPAHNHFFDAVAWHVYSRPADAFERVQRSRALLHARVGPKAIWINEGNLPAWPESRLNSYAPFPLSGTLEEQAAWVVQWHAYALAAGADRVVLYRMHDSDEPEAWGLARSDGTLRPAFVAYQLAARYFSHATSVTRAPQGDVEQIVFDRPGQRVVALWSRVPRPQTARVGAAAPQAQLVALDGTPHLVVPRGGVYEVALPPATANTGLTPDDYLVGGAPFLLVEELPTSAQRHEETDALLGWSGRWQTEALPTASGGWARTSAQPGATVHFAFEGPTVTWYTAEGPRGGIARLSLDGQPLDEVDLYRPAPLAPAARTYTDLGPGPHVLAVTVTGERHSAALGAQVVVDAFVAETAHAAPAPPPVAEHTPAPPLVPATPAPPSATPTASRTASPGPAPSPTATPTLVPTTTATPTPAIRVLPTSVAPVLPASRGRAP